MFVASSFLFSSRQPAHHCECTLQICTRGQRKARLHVFFLSFFVVLISIFSICVLSALFIRFQNTGPVASVSNVAECGDPRPTAFLGFRNLSLCNKMPVVESLSDSSPRPSATSTMPTAAGSPAPPHHSRGDPATGHGEPASTGEEEPLEAGCQRRALRAIGHAGWRRLDEAMDRLAARHPATYFGVRGETCTHAVLQEATRLAYPGRECVWRKLRLPSEKKKVSR